MKNKQAKNCHQDGKYPSVNLIFFSFRGLFILKTHPDCWCMHHSYLQRAASLHRLVIVPKNSKLLSPSLLYGSLSVVLYSLVRLVELVSFPLKSCERQNPSRLSEGFWRKIPPGRQSSLRFRHLRAAVPTLKVTQAQEGILRMITLLSIHNLSLLSHDAAPVSGRHRRRPGNVMAISSLTCCVPPQGKSQCQCCCN